MSEFDARLGARMKSLRVSKGLTQQNVADNLGINRPAVGLMESGKRKLYVQELAKLAKLFSTTSDVILNPQVRDDLDVFEFLLWRLDYNSTDIGEFSKYVKWEYIISFLDEAREKYGKVTP